MKRKLANIIYNTLFLSLAILILSGCRGGGGGGSSGLSSSSGDAIVGSDSWSSDSGSSSGTSSLVTVHNPEPSSILLLASGLVGMAVYAKTMLKAKSKK